jgi:hypothetical protein
MESTNLKVISSPPSLMKSLMAGFDVVSNHIGLIFFSILFDLLLWFGPQLKLANAFAPVIEQIGSLSEVQSAGSFDMLKEGLARLNMLSLLRTFPIGVPSLLAGQAPSKTPIYPRIDLNVRTLVDAAFLWLLIVLIGMAAGTLYFSLIAQASVRQQLDYSQALRNWPRNFGQVLLLTLFLNVLFATLLIPFTCMMTFVLLLGMGLGQFSNLIVLLFGVLLIWLMIPLFFSPHGIFTGQRPMWDSIVQSIRLSRATFTTTALLILTIFVLSQGLDVLWNMPQDNSWFLLVGITGHAFVTAALLAATFVYYQSADSWLKEIIQQRELIQV